MSSKNFKGRLKIPEPGCLQMCVSLTYFLTKTMYNIRLYENLLFYAGLFIPTIDRKTGLLQISNDEDGCPSMESNRSVGKGEILVSPCLLGYLTDLAVWLLQVCLA